MLPKAPQAMHGHIPMIKTVGEVEKMRVAGRLTARVLEALGEVIKPGMSTADIDDFCEDYIRNVLKAIPGSKGQYNFPYSVNTSPNHVVCHGMPSKTVILKRGDIVNVDVTVKSDGFYGDSSKMYCIEPVPTHARRLIDAAQQCMYRAIRSIGPGSFLSDIGSAIEDHARQFGYSVVREYCGHGIGRQMHEAPQVLHFFDKRHDILLQPGMTFTIEPMINQGKRHVKLLSDGWTVVTTDRRLSAQWEHTILITEAGVEILTLRTEEMAQFAEKQINTLLLQADAELAGALKPQLSC